MSETTEQVSQMLRARLNEIGHEAAGIERAIAVIAKSKGGAFKASKTRGSATNSSDRSAARKPRRAKRAARGERQAQLLAAIKANPTQGPAELAKTIGIAPSQAHALVAKARAEKLISKQGKGYSVKATATKATEPKSG
jgi:predicted HTH transcriptional regulator